jgi:hypothetical protein
VRSGVIACVAQARAIESRMSSLLWHTRRLSTCHSASVARRNNLICQARADVCTQSRAPLCVHVIPPQRFTGWYDVALSEAGEIEARQAGKLLKEGNFKFDLAYTRCASVLQ